MIRIAILEHEDETKRAVFTLARIFSKADWTFRHYYKASALAKALNDEHYDIFIFDEMFRTPRMDSVFVHDHPEAMVLYICDDPAVHEKSDHPARLFFLDRSHIEQSLEDIELELRQSAHAKDLFSLQAGGIKIELPFSDIYYMEKIEKNVYFHTAKGVFHRRENLSSLEDIFEPHGFIRPHVSFLVNRHYILQVGRDEILLANRERIPISRAQKKKLGLHVRSRAQNVQNTLKS